NIFSIAIVIFLDLFILGNLFDGLANQTKMLTKPTDEIPHVVRDIMINSNWVENNRVEKLSNYVLSKKRSYYYLDNINKEKLHPESLKVIEELEKIQNDKGLISLFKRRENHWKNYNKLDNYQKSLESQGKMILEKIETLDKEINNNPNIKGFWKIIENREDVSEELAEDIRKSNFFFPIKELIVQFIFLIPLLTFFVWWNIVSLKKAKSIQIFISSHLILITLIPIFFKICEMVFDIIPDKIIKTFIDYLESIKLIGIWNYILTAVAVLFGLALVYLSQKKLFNKERIMKNRFKKGRCIHCGVSIKKDDDYCYDCGGFQKKECPHCGEMIPKVSKFCTECGEKEI
ncbi:MAG: zinc ribbon domain-containing protein, partial [Fusobacteriota bacterium]